MPDDDADSGTPESALQVSLHHLHLAALALSTATWPAMEGEELVALSLLDETVKAVQRLAFSRGVADADEPDAAGPDVRLVDDRAVVVRPPAHCDVAALRAVADRVLRLFDVAAPRIVVDMSEVSALDPMAVTALVRLQADCFARGGELAVVAGAAVRAAYDASIAPPLVPLAASVDEALAPPSAPSRRLVSRLVDVGETAQRTLRGDLRTLLEKWDVETAVANAALDVGHELVANAHRHGRPPVLLTLEATAGEVFVCVHDASPDAAVLRPYRLGVSESGLGLHLVRQLSARWGQAVDPEGKLVWARIGRDRAAIPLQDAGRPARQRRASGQRGA